MCKFLMMGSMQNSLRLILFVLCKKTDFYFDKNLHVTHVITSVFKCISNIYSRSVALLTLFHSTPICIKKLNFFHNYEEVLAFYYKPFSVIKKQPHQSWRDRDTRVKVNILHKYALNNNIITILMAWYIWVLASISKMLFFSLWYTYPFF